MWIAAENLALVPAWVTAIATSCGVVIAAGALWFAYSQIRQTATQMRETARREAADSEARTRPYVTARIVTGLGGAPSLDMIIENRGRTTAHDVRMEPSSGVFGEEGRTPEHARALTAMFAEGFDLGPGERRRIFWRVDPVDTDIPPSDQSNTVRDELELTYQWRPADSSLPERKYTDTVSFDMVHYIALIPSPTTGATSTGLKGLDREVRDLAHAVRAISYHLGELYR